MLSNMANSLIINKRIVTTVAKAKELRKYVEPLLTKSKEDTTHNRRIVFSYLKSKESIKALFGEVSEKIATRNGGYTRIIKLGTRQGDAAETAMIELVDYNDLLMASSSEAPAKAKRTRRAGSKKVDGVVAAPAADVIQDAVVVDESIAEAPVADEPTAEAPVADEPIVDEVATSSEDAPETDNEASPDDEPAAQA
jgi:large subunit ribosomal protein L17